MIIKKIIYTAEEQRELEKIKKEYETAIKDFRETKPLKMDGETPIAVLEILSSLGSRQEILEKSIEARHMEELGTPDAILEEAKEIIQALEKKDFQEYVRPLRKSLQRQTPEMKRDKVFQNAMKRYSYTFEGAYKFILTEVLPYYKALKNLGETEIIDAGKRIRISYSELLEVEALRKARDGFGYKPPTERKKRGQKQTVSLKEELNTVEDIEPSELYGKMISDSVTRSVETSIGEKPKTDPVSQYRIIENKYGQLEWIGDTDPSILDEVERKAIPAESVLLLYMLLRKLTPQLPTLKQFKGKLKPKEQEELEKIRDTLNDEKIRTVSLTLNEYMENRRSKDRKASAKQTIEYALKSIGSMEVFVGSTGKGYYMFSSKPQEMYRAGNIEAVFNYDWCTHLYTDGSKLVYFPDPLYTVDLRKHPHAVILYIWLRSNYEANEHKQKPHTNRVKVMTTIENVPALKENYYAERESGNARYWQRVIEPLLSNLDALKKTYGVLEYEILGKDKKKITASKFNKMPNREKLECWIRYELIGYPDWKAPEQLTTKKQTAPKTKK